MREKKTLAQANHVDGMARAVHFDPYLASLFVHTPCRDWLRVVLAFSSELAHVRDAVTEELLAHIRYAWWEESLDLMKEGKSPRAQPTLEAIAPLLAAGVITRDELAAIVDAYRNAYPNLPQMDEAMFTLSEKLVCAHAPQSLAGWQKACKLIRTHRERHQGGKTALLQLKLLFSGLF